jgi:predicted transcriptional regulator
MAMLRDGSLEGRLNQMDDTFQEKLFELIDKKNLKDSDVYQKANIDKRLFSKIRSDSEYHPSKATVILLCLGLELEIDTALDLIARAGYSLSFSTKADVIIRYFIENKKYDVIEINQALYDHDVNVLFK